MAAGIFSSGQSQNVLANSRGLSASYRQTHATFSVTMQAGSAASWAKGTAADYRQFDPLALAQIASDKGRRAQNPVELEPGRYTVILEPAAVLDLVGFLFYDLLFWTCRQNGCRAEHHDNRRCVPSRTVGRAV